MTAPFGMGCRVMASLQRGQPLDGSTITYIQNAIDAAGGSDTQVGQFLQSLFSQAAGVEQGSLFQSITSSLSGSRDGIFQQAVQRVRDANGGILPSLDGSFVEQVMQLINNGFGGVGGR
ncbi:hypothetical protein DUNSADRAFT_15569 [Dunaliella salina]|uniref:Uncharacterized protein n=1 Tax=Dunaliella salina TaxID=3046 RepID=A0ABQ7G559_DUNSA|nr:hypothetical protein DUNSADRAFT_15569 [Dunaliella salina]|eukprot:KAF5829737.1 hypothetical protein DUNSADRAFT_15569 [Dunaliella salina]